MSEKQPIKPEAKKKHHEILRPTTEGHIMTGEIDPELERNQPDNLKEKEKTKLDINSAKFMPKNYKPKTSNQINDNAPKQPNDFKNHVNKYKYSQPHTNNNYGKIMNMNMPPYSNVPYYYPQQMNINQGYPNNNQFSGPNFQNFQNTMNNPNYPPQQQPYPIGYYQNYNNQNMIPQNNNNYNNYNNNYYNRANPNNQKKYNENNKEKNNPLVTKLSLDAKHFIPSYKQKDKDLDINADPYIPRNQNLKKKEEQTHPKKEENQPVKKKESDLSKLLNSMDSEKTKSTHSKASEKKIADIKKKSSKKSDYDKKFEAVSKNKEKLEKEEAEKQKRKKKEEEEKQKKAEEERKRKEEEERKRKEEEERKRKEEEERKRKEEEEKTIEKKYFIIFKNKKPEKKEKFTFEYIFQFKNWNICKANDLLPDEVKHHFDSFKDEIKEAGKKKRDRERDRDRDDTKKRDHYKITKSPKGNNETKLTPLANSMEQWARTDLTTVFKAAEDYKKQLQEESQKDTIKKDLRDLLNKLTPDNYNEIKKEILNQIKDSIENQNAFLDVLFQKAVMEKAYVKLYAKLVKDLDKDLPQKSKKKEKEGEKEKEKTKKKEYSEMRANLIDKCKIIFQIEKNEKFDEYIKEKDPVDRRFKLKKMIIGNVNFITELMKIKILSKKVGPDCLRNLYDRYQKEEVDKTLKELTVEAIIAFTEKFGRILYEEDKSIKQADKELFQSKIDNIFKKLAKIKEEPSLPGYIKYNIINLEEKRKNNFALSKFDESQIAKTKKEVEKELEKEGRITQENINERMKKELKRYKESHNKEENEEDKEEEKENVDIWKETSYIMRKTTNGFQTFGDILEGFFICACEILDEEKKTDYLKDYIKELIYYYVDEFEEFGRKKLKELTDRLLKLFELILDLSLDVPGILDTYAYVINIFIKKELMEIKDLAELKKKDEPLDKISTVLKALSKYYTGDDFCEQIKKIPYVEEKKDLFEWAFK